MSECGWKSTIINYKHHRHSGSASQNAFHWQIVSFASCGSFIPQFSLASNSGVEDIAVVMNVVIRAEFHKMAFALESEWTH